MSSIKTIQQILSDIQKFSPHPDRVKILAVSKKQAVSKISDLISQKQNIFGENYVQEALEKMDALPKFLEWHLIGHLQSKKVNSVIGKFAFIQSIDSIKLAGLIGQKSLAANLIQNVFIEVNLGGEDSKTGFSAVELTSRWSELISIEGVKIWGLMVLPPLSDDEGQTRKYFKQIKQLFLDLRSRTNLEIHPMSDLSMGTSHDYQIALQEGSTLIRVGTILFGERT